jgi:hypothetical protein
MILIEPSLTLRATGIAMGNVSSMPEPAVDASTLPDRSAEIIALTQRLDEARSIADALDLHLCAALVDQAADRARSEISHPNLI